jgi:CO dehydrogenase/acetyl-CoA synthase gamma subunit (corrinoid Fe-S protein)
MTSDQIFLTVSKGDRSAAEFLSMIFHTAHVWDDLIDKDTVVSDQSINSAFLCTLVHLPRNAFYRQNFELLNPVIVTAIHNWMVANKLEATEAEEDLRIAFISRSGYVDVINQVAFIVGGTDWVADVGPVVRRFVHQEGWDAYLDSLKKPAPEQEGE